MESMHIFRLFIFLLGPADLTFCSLIDDSSEIQLLINRSKTNHAISEQNLAQNREKLQKLSALF